MKDAVTTIAVPGRVRILNAALPKVSPLLVAALTDRLDRGRDSWSAMLARHPHLTRRLATVKARRA